MTENIITIIFIEYVGGSDIFFGGGGGGGGEIFVTFARRS